MLSTNRQNTPEQQRFDALQRKKEVDRTQIERKKEFLVNAMGNVLNLMAPEYGTRIKMSDFEQQFNSLTQKSFKKKLYWLLKRSDVTTPKVLFSSIQHEYLKFSLEEDTIVIEGDVPSSSQREMASKRAFHVSNIAGHSSYQKIHGEKIVFTAPCWPQATDEERVKHQQWYKEAIESNIPDWSMELARLWWAPHIKKWPQICYVLHKLGVENADGYFLLTELDEKLLASFPRAWRQSSNPIKINYAAFGIEKSDLIQYNLIVRYDADSPNKYTVNKIIMNCVFNEIDDQFASLIYDLLNSYEALNVEDIDKMLCKSYSGWKSDDIMNREQKILKTVQEMINLFTMDGLEISAKRDSGIIMVPIHFSPFDGVKR